MPMFQEHLGPSASHALGSLDDDESDTYSTPDIPTSAHRTLSRQASEESIRTELCEGPIPDSPPKPSTPQQDTEAPTTVSDRAELIERLKKGESPTWIPNRHLESLFQQDATRRSPPRTPRALGSKSPTLLPPPTITPEKQQNGLVDDTGPETQLHDGMAIERPRSALHSGNFTPEESSPDAVPPRRDQGEPSGSSHMHSTSAALWIDTTSPPRDFHPFSSSRSATADYRREAFRSSGPSSLSSSLSSFVYKPPTSPLVQSESNDELDLSLPLNSINIDASPRYPRRHTLNFAQSPSLFAHPAGQRQPAPPRREASHPYQAHQPRRSLNSATSFPLAVSSPQTPAFLRSRRPSISSEVSPLQHASMVGSYEESILRGRMSTTPSKPLEFMAQIGVLGLGKCKPSLRCPSHVTLPFSAVFYSYASTAHGRSKSEDGPSPYVGQIDLENGLPNPDEGLRARRKLQSRYPDRAHTEEDGEPSADQSEGAARSKSTKNKRRSRSPKAPPGGRYRIPEKGQLQIIIKNQNKTAVKLFLVPYDLAGMEPGTKTFIRQRSYSAGPIIDNVPDFDRPVPASDSTRPTLRYLIHLHICCPSKGRFYLYKSIRVVFANRVPDGKEKLRNELTFPDPRFSPYKPVRVMHPPSGHGTTMGGPGATLAAEQANRRKSIGFIQHPTFSTAASIPDHEDSGFNTASFSMFARSRVSTVTAPVQSTSLDTAMGTTPSSLDAQAAEGMHGVIMTGLTAAAEASKYDKLSKGDVGYGGNAFAGGPNGVVGATEGLLSQRLRSLGSLGAQQTDSSAQEEDQERGLEL